VHGETQRFTVTLAAEMSYNSLQPGIYDWRGAQAENGYEHNFAAFDTLLVSLLDFIPGDVTDVHLWRRLARRP